MECKLKPQKRLESNREGINRYIMECKYACSLGTNPGAVQELIDTLWNVNYMEFGTFDNHES